MATKPPMTDEELEAAYWHLRAAVEGHMDERYSGDTSGMYSTDRRLYENAGIIAPQPPVNQPRITSSGGNFLDQYGRDADEDGVLQGETRIDPDDGNAYVLADRYNEGAGVTITDIFGGHERNISAGRWESWKEQE